MNERRKSQRVDNKIDLTYRVIYSLGFGSEIKDGHGTTESINISEGGISFFVLDQLIPEGSFLELELKIASADYPVYLKGNVVHAEKRHTEYVIGLEFEYKFENDIKILQDYLTQNN